MDLSSELCIDVIEDFKSLNKHLEELTLLICQEDGSLPAWFQCPKEISLSGNQNDRESISNFLNQLEYIDNQPPKEIILGPGWLACSDKTILAANKVNEQKMKFKQSVIALKSHNNIKIVADEFENILNKRPKDLSNKLNKIGLARLHLKQCYRQIPILDSTPSRISWTWANTKAITKISKQEAINMLSKKPQSSEINYQMQKLLTIGDHEKLAIVQVLAPHLRANLVFLGDNGEIKRKMIKGAMPILFPYEQCKVPFITPPKDKSGYNPERVTRSDVKLESEPFLPALRAYRYKERDLAIAD